MLRNLGDADKKDLVDLLAAIEKTFSLYWRHYPPYHTLQDRSSALDTLLKDDSTNNRSGELPICVSSVVWYLVFVNAA